MTIRTPTSAQQELTYTDASSPENYIDVSLESPETQFETLVAMIEAADAKSPAPRTRTPPWGEGIDPSETMSEGVLEENYLPAPDYEAMADAHLLEDIEDAPDSQFPHPVWENDSQYHGLGVPPGIENFGQPIESGHTQNVRPDPTDHTGWDHWSGKPLLARQARHENDFPSYNAGTSRGHGISPIKLRMPYVWRTQQARDMLLVELKRRGVHNVVTADVPVTTYTDEVIVTDPQVMMPSPEIGPEGVR